MAKHKMTEAHYAVLLIAQDGERDFGPNSEGGEKVHKAAMELMGTKFGDEMLRGVNTRCVTGLTPAGEAALAKHLATPL